jgi:glucose-6-phosphate 1-dehydrogenase
VNIALDKADTEPAPIGGQDPCAVVIFGASGDLAKRKLVPALYNLFSEGHLPESLAIIGALREGTREAFITSIEDWARQHSRNPINRVLWTHFSRTIDVATGDYSDPDFYKALRAQLEDVERTRGTGGNRLFYLATPPTMFVPIVQHLKASGLVRDAGAAAWSRVIIEKPFGRDLHSARELNTAVAEALDERQVYRIDHYLGKETVQNILVFRLGNSIFEPIWNRKYIDHVQITAAEELGVENRAKFYDATGVLRDVVQNHLLQVLALCAMETPVSFRADDVRDRKTEVWRSLRPLEGRAVIDSTVRAQYRGYRGIPGVAPDSRTPTYSAMKVHVDNWRWQGVPFYLRAGKRMGARVTEVSVCFQPIPLGLFEPGRAHRVAPNVLTLRIQPDEGISLRFAAKTPGDGMGISNILMDMNYDKAFGSQIAEAYERLLLDTIRGDATLFIRRDGVEQAWAFITPILEAWDAERDGELPVYEPGSDGPAEADALLARDGHAWRPLTS